MSLFIGKKDQYSKGKRRRCLIVEKTKWHTGKKIRKELQTEVNLNCFIEKIHVFVF